MVKNWSLTGVVILLLLGGLLHFWKLSSPREVVFDEVHFGKFVTAYCCTGENFFDIHPPHAKLLTAGTAYVLGYRGGFDFDHIGEPYGDIPVVALRTFSAITGTLIPVVLFLLLLQFGVRPAVALVGSLFVLFDTSLLLQTRVVALDGLLILAQFGALSAYLASLSGKDKYRWWWLALSGVLSGLAVGTKFTGLAVLALIGAIVLVRAFSKKTLTPFVHGLFLLGVAVLVYLGGWMLHFTLLTQPGSGDVWYTETGQFFTDTIALHEKMLGANYGLTATHPFMSPWWTWPVMGVPVFYWQGPHAFMYFLGNPILWWGVAVLFIVAIINVFYAFLNQLPANRYEYGLWILGLGYLIAFFPLVRVPSALFLYHYLTPFIFSLLFGVVWFDRNSLSQYSGRKLNIILGVSLAIVFGFFVLFSPLAFGFEISSMWESLLFWFPAWRSGLGV